MSSLHKPLAIPRRPLPPPRPSGDIPYSRGIDRSRRGRGRSPWVVSSERPHHHLDEIPGHLRGLADVRGFGIGERIVFLPYTREMYERAQQWMHERRLFDETRPATAYEAVVYRASE